MLVNPPGPALPPTPSDGGVGGRGRPFFLKDFTDTLRDAPFAQAPTAVLVLVHPPWPALPPTPSADGVGGQGRPFFFTFCARSDFKKISKFGL